VQENEEEIDHRDGCFAELNTNDGMLAGKNRDKDDLEATIDAHKMTISELTKAIEELQSQIEEAKGQIKRPGENCER